MQRRKSKNRIIGISVFASMLFTMLFGLGFTYGFEIHTLMTTGDWDWKDFIAMIGGSIIGQFFQILIVLCIMI